MTGRFLSVDSHWTAAKVPQGWNRYAYARGNPVKFFDPTGDETELVFSKNDFTNPVGHIAIAINGKVYSYGTNYTGGPSGERDWGRSEETYVDRQKNSREVDMIQLKVSPDQEATLKAYLESHNPYAAGQPGYSTLGNSCVSVCEAALQHSGIMPADPGTEHFNGAGDQLQSGGPGGALLPSTLVSYVARLGSLDRRLRSESSRCRY